MRRQAVKSRTGRRFSRTFGLPVALVAILATGAATAQPVQAAAAHGRRGVVVAGQARFQVLSPTLIRTEYAGDGAFTDAATFNAIGRTAFTPPSYTSTVSGGVLTIRTSALTL